MTDRVSEFQLKAMSLRQQYLSGILEETEYNLRQQKLTEEAEEASAKEQVFTDDNLAQSFPLMDDTKVEVPKELIKSLDDRIKTLVDEKQRPAFSSIDTSSTPTGAPGDVANFLITVKTALENATVGTLRNLHFQITGLQSDFVHMLPDDLVTFLFNGTRPDLSKDSE